ncbi:hypothetical protein AC1031_008921 [Aphanomyces cochlioides]|nr:hypothetical protein AC1031_008921 [Aphanomyces cochlioides]
MAPKKPRLSQDHIARNGVLALQTRYGVVPHSGSQTARASSEVDEQKPARRAIQPRVPRVQSVEENVDMDDPFVLQARYGVTPHSGSQTARASSEVDEQKPARRAIQPRVPRVQSVEENVDMDDPFVLQARYGVTPHSGSQTARASSEVDEQKPARRAIQPRVPRVQSVEENVDMDDPFVLQARYGVTPHSGSQTARASSEVDEQKPARRAIQPRVPRVQSVEENVDMDDPFVLQARYGVTPHSGSQTARASSEVDEQKPARRAIQPRVPRVQSVEENVDMDDPFVLQARYGVTPHSGSQTARASSEVDEQKPARRAIQPRVPRVQSVEENVDMDDPFVLQARYGVTPHSGSQTARASSEVDEQKPARRAIQPRVPRVQSVEENVDMDDPFVLQARYGVTPHSGSQTARASSEVDEQKPARRAIQPRVPRVQSVEENVDMDDPFVLQARYGVTPHSGSQTARASSEVDEQKPARRAIQPRVPRVQSVEENVDMDDPFVLQARYGVTPHSGSQTARASSEVDEQKPARRAIQPRVPRVQSVEENVDMDDPFVLQARYGVTPHSGSQTARASSEVDEQKPARRAIQPRVPRVQSVEENVDMDDPFVLQARYGVTPHSGSQTARASSEVDEQKPARRAIQPRVPRVQSVEENVDMDDPFVLQARYGVTPHSGSQTARASSEVDEQKPARRAIQPRVPRVQSVEENVDMDDPFVLQARYGVTPHSGSQTARASSEVDEQKPARRAIQPRVPRVQSVEENVDMDDPFVLQARYGVTPHSGSQTARASSEVDEQKPARRAIQPRVPRVQSVEENVDMDDPFVLQARYGVTPHSGSQTARASSEVDEQKPARRAIQPRVPRVQSVEENVDMDDPFVLQARYGVTPHSGSQTARASSEVDEQKPARRAIQPRVPRVQSVEENVDMDDPFVLQARYGVTPHSGSQTARASSEVDEQKPARRAIQPRVPRVQSVEENVDMDDPFVLQARYGVTPHSGSQTARASSEVDEQKPARRAIQPRVPRVQSVEENVDMDDPFVLQARYGVTPHSGSQTARASSEVDEQKPARRAIQPRVPRVQSVEENVDMDDPFVLQARYGVTPHSGSQTARASSEVDEQKPARRAIQPRVPRVQSVEENVDMDDPFVLQARYGVTPHSGSQTARASSEVDEQKPARRAIQPRVPRVQSVEENVDMDDPFVLQARYGVTPHSGSQTARASSEVDEQKPARRAIQPRVPRVQSVEENVDMDDPFVLQARYGVTPHSGSQTARASSEVDEQKPARRAIQPRVPRVQSVEENVDMDDPFVLQARYGVTPHSGSQTARASSEVDEQKPARRAIQPRVPRVQSVEENVDMDDPFVLQARYGVTPHSGSQTARASSEVDEQKPARRAIQPRVPRVQSVEENVDMDDPFVLQARYGVTPHSGSQTARASSEVDEQKPARRAIQPRVPRVQSVEENVDMDDPFVLQARYGVTPHSGSQTARASSEVDEQKPARRAIQPRVPRVQSVEENVDMDDPFVLQARYGVTPHSGSQTARASSEVDEQKPARRAIQPRVPRVQSVEENVDMDDPFVLQARYGVTPHLDHKRRVHLLRSMNKNLHDAQFNHEVQSVEENVDMDDPFVLQARYGVTPHSGSQTARASSEVDEQKPARRAIQPRVPRVQSVEENVDMDDPFVLQARYGVTPHSGSQTARASSEVDEQKPARRAIQPRVPRVQSVEENVDMDDPFVLQARYGVTPHSGSQTARASSEVDEQKPARRAIQPRVPRVQSVEENVDMDDPFVLQARYGVTPHSGSQTARASSEVDEQKPARRAIQPRVPRVQSVEENVDMDDPFVLQARYGVTPHSGSQTARASSEVDEQKPARRAIQPRVPRVQSVEENVDMDDPFVLQARYGVTPHSGSQTARASSEVDEQKPARRAIQPRVPRVQSVEENVDMDDPFVLQARYGVTPHSGSQTARASSEVDEQKPARRAIQPRVPRVQSVEENVDMDDPFVLQARYGVTPHSGSQTARASSEVDEQKPARRAIQPRVPRVQSVEENVDMDDPFVLQARYGVTPHSGSQTARASSEVDEQKPARRAIQPRVPRVQSVEENVDMDDPFVLQARYGVTPHSGSQTARASSEVDEQKPARRAIQPRVPRVQSVEENVDMDDPFVLQARYGVTPHSGSQTARASSEVDEQKPARRAIQPRVPRVQSVEENVDMDDPFVLQARYGVTPHSGSQTARASSEVDEQKPARRAIQPRVPRVQSVEENVDMDDPFVLQARYGVTPHSGSQTARASSEVDEQKPARRAIQPRVPRVQSVEENVDMDDPFVLQARYGVTPHSGSQTARASSEVDEQKPARRAIQPRVPRVQSVEENVDMDDPFVLQARYGVTPHSGSQTARASSEVDEQKPARRAIQPRVPRVQSVEENVDMDDPFVLQARYGVTPHSGSQTARASSEVDEQKPARRAIQPRVPRVQSVEENVDMDDPFVLQARYGVTPHSGSQTARASSEVDEQKPARRAIQPRVPRVQSVEENVDMDDPFVLQARYGVTPHSGSQTARASSEVDEQKPARRAIQPRVPRVQSVEENVDMDDPFVLQARYGVTPHSGSQTARA